MKLIQRVIKSSDIYGNIIGFKYEGDDRIKSVLGGCLTVCLLITSIVVLIITFVNWATNDYNLEIKTSTFNKDLTYPDSFNSTFLGFRFGVLELKNNGAPTILGELNPMGDNSINQVSLAAQPFLHEEQNKIGDIINCYENNQNEFLSAFVKFQDNSFKDTYKNFLCSNISKGTNITLGSDFVVSNQTDYLEANLYFDICKVTSNCTDPIALHSTLKDKFRLYFSLNNQFFDRYNYEGFTSTFSSYIYHRLDFNKDLDIDVVVTKNIVITDPNQLFTLLNSYSTEFYSYNADIKETNRPEDLDSSDKTIMKVKIVFRVDDSEVYIYRNYERIENLVANIATILFAIYFVFKLLLFFFKKGNLTLSLLNKIYKFKEEDDSKIDFEAFQSVMKFESNLGQIREQEKQNPLNNKKNNKQEVKKNNNDNNPKNEIDISLANLNHQNESHQDNPLRIVFKGKENSDTTKKDNDIDKERTFNITNNTKADKSLQKSKSNRVGDDSKKAIIEMPNIIYDKCQQSMIEVSNFDEDPKNLPGLVYLTNIDKDEKFLNKLDIPKTRLFFFVCFGQCYRRNNLAANYYYVGKEFLNYDLNIETFLKKAIEYEALKKLLLTENNRKMLLNYQRRRVTKDNFAKTLNEMRSLTQ